MFSLPFSLSLRISHLGLIKSTVTCWKVLDVIILLLRTVWLYRDSSLNKLRYIHVTDGLSPDCMHDILEGTLQFEIKELLKSLIAQRLITLEGLKKRIELFPYDACDGVNKPSPITNLSSKDHSLRDVHLHVCLWSFRLYSLTVMFQISTATQMWCLGRLLPLLIR